MESKFENTYQVQDANNSENAPLGGLDASQLWSEMESGGGKTPREAKADTEVADKPYLSISSMAALGTEKMAPLDSTTAPVGPERAASRGHEEKRPGNGGDDPGARKRPEEEPPSGDRPEGDEARLERETDKRLYRQAQMAGILWLSINPRENQPFAAHTLSTIERNLSRLANDRQRESYLSGLNNVLQSRGLQLVYVDGVDAGGNPARRLQVQNLEGRALPLNPRA